ncbi:hypothetical protein PIROE2DRAFT_15159 [Piromyces sp. E2]|nr:hypothetical protein PIROE2DRAFT_15159 [Piromyces sp. E2]|eukprot:OUM59333.1 hypothetical protein PIROE2DRAFT_15159 [Piromyces sp. E2]
MNINTNTNIKNLYSNNISTGVISNAIVVNGLKFMNNYINNKDNNINNSKSNSNINNSNNNNNKYNKNTNVVFNNNNNNNTSKINNQSRHNNYNNQSKSNRINKNIQNQSDNLGTEKIKYNKIMDPHIHSTNQVVVQQQPPQQEFDEFNPFQTSIQLPSSLPNQGSYTSINPNVPPPLPDVDNVQSNNLILSSLEQQYFSNFLESFLAENDTDLINNDPLQNPPPFVNNMNDDLKNQIFPIQDSNLFYSMVNDMPVPPPSISNNPNMLSPQKQPSSQPVNIIPPENHNSIPTPNSLLQEKIEVVPKINTNTNNYLNPPNATNDVKDQLSPLSGNPENMNNSFENPLDHSKFTLFSDPPNMPKNQGKQRVI